MTTTSHILNYLILHELLVAYTKVHSVKSIATYLSAIIPQNIDYDPSTGRIKSKNFVPFDMNYGEAGNPPRALSTVEGIPDGIFWDSIKYTYNDINKTQSITNNSKTHQLVYGFDNQRTKGNFKTVNATTMTRYYLGNYEEEINSAGNARKLHYISGSNGLAAIMVHNGATDSLYYTYCDYQSNLLAITDAAGNLKEKYAYDPWGYRVNPTDRKQKDPRKSFIFSRGYTLHEHLDDYGLINMNGRMYDPLMGQFLSPDAYVQAPGSWYSYNRYVYCLNNPLIYSDPDGEIAWLIPAIKIGIMMYMAGAQTNFMYSAQNGGNPMNPGDWNWKNPNTYIGMSSGLLGQYYQVPGILSNGFLQAGIQVTNNGIGNLIEGQDFFDNWYWSAANGFIFGGIQGYFIADAYGKNYW